MKLDAEIMFDCLLYINAFYYGMFFACNFVMTISKYYSAVITPNIGRDAAVTFSLLAVEFLKLIIYKKYKEAHRGISSTFVIIMNAVTLACCFYMLKIMNPVLKLEKLLCILLWMLASCEIFFGCLQPWFKKKPYYT
ncbi:uncharacterized protein LOC123312137 isoform X2 [Coccinella septempunctata]|uniref:uncharacterized protein LOC123312137 isoform X2 n=1 Tax=Coccinella septempunctata TaxID=41139 RepID=UPI001D05D98E|nr:uncharacterized protein LOC123312137 isoform X2 [Coccinella septempunctata]